MTGRESSRFTHSWVQDSATASDADGDGVPMAEHTARGSAPTAGKTRVARVSRRRRASRSDRSSCAMAADRDGASNALLGRSFDDGGRKVHMRHGVNLHPQRRPKACSEDSDHGGGDVVNTTGRLDSIITNLERVRRVLCCYDIGLGEPPRTCDCKYGIAHDTRPGGEQTACPELRDAIRLLRQLQRVLVDADWLLTYDEWSDVARAGKRQ